MCVCNDRGHNYGASLDTGMDMYILSSLSLYCSIMSGQSSGNSTVIVAGVLGGLVAILLQAYL